MDFKSGLNPNSGINPDLKSIIRILNPKSGFDIQNRGFKSETGCEIRNPDLNRI
jgi:hypothetical protein